jgi:hypothetical protein
VKRLLDRGFIIFSQTPPKHGKNIFGNLITSIPPMKRNFRHLQAIDGDLVEELPVVSLRANPVLLVLEMVKIPCVTRKYRLIILALLHCLVLCGQDGPSAWGTVFVNGPYKKGWGLHLDAQLRSGANMSQLKTWLVRPGLQYQLNKRNLLTLGYAYVHGIAKTTGVSAYTPEHRIWQQWLYLQPIRRFTLQHRFRLEERFIGPTRFTEGVAIPSISIYSTRFRYFNRLILPWPTKRPFERGLFGAIQNEVFFHATGREKLNGKWFDQNRFYLALGYRPAPVWDLEIGYMRRDVQTTSSLIGQHTWQLAVYLRPE